MNISDKIIKAIGEQFGCSTVTNSDSGELKYGISKSELEPSGWYSDEGEAWRSEAGIIMYGFMLERALDTEKATSVMNHIADHIDEIFG